MKFLIIRFSSIGDIVLTTPVVRCLKKKYPDSEIHYLVKKTFAVIVESNPNISKVLYLQNDLRETLADIDKENYDHIIDLHNNLRTFRINKAFKKIPFHSFQKLNTQKWIYTNLKINLLPHKHIVDRYMQTVAVLGVNNDEAGLDYFIPEKDFVKDSDIPFSHLQGYVGIAIGAAHRTKKLPLDMIKKLCQIIQFPIILLGGNEDYYNAVEVASEDPTKIYNSCGKFNLNESADIIRRSKLVITHDTGLMHIAAAFKKNVLSVWGNTVPSFGMYPYQTMYQVFQVNKLWCRPCSKIGYDKCPLGHFKCMKKQSVASIADSVHYIVNSYPES